MRPHGIATSKAGEIVVSDYKREELYLFRANGSAHIQTISREGNSAVALHSPWGVAVDDGGDIFVAHQCAAGCKEGGHGRISMLGFRG
jgi:hypothetical protein